MKVADHGAQVAARSYFLANQLKPGLWYLRNYPGPFFFVLGTQSVELAFFGKRVAKRGKCDSHRQNLNVTIVSPEREKSTMISHFWFAKVTGCLKNTLIATKAYGIL